MELLAAEAQAEAQANGSARSVKLQRRKTTIKTSASKMSLGEATDDVHVCIMCLRAIMNHQVTSASCVCAPS